MIRSRRLASLAIGLVVAFTLTGEIHAQRGGRGGAGGGRSAGNRSAGGGASRSPSMSRGSSGGMSGGMSRPGGSSGGMSGGMSRPGGSPGGMSGGMSRPGGSPGGMQRPGGSGSPTGGLGQAGAAGGLQRPGGSGSPTGGLGQAGAAGGLQRPGGSGSPIGGLGQAGAAGGLQRPGGTGPIQRPSNDALGNFLGMDGPSSGGGGLQRPGAGEGLGGLQRPGEGAAGLQRPGEGAAGLQRPGEGLGGLQRPGEGAAGMQRPGEGAAGLQRPGGGLGTGTTLGDRNLGNVGERNLTNIGAGAGAANIGRGDTNINVGEVNAGNQVAYSNDRNAWVSQRQNWGNEVRGGVGNRYGNVFNDSFYRGGSVRGGYNYWNSWGAISPNHAWQPATWATFGAFMGAAAASSQPIYNGYGEGGNVYYENNVVYVDGQPAGTPEQYYQQAQTLAAAAPPADQVAPQEEWMPLGVFAVTSEDTPDAHAAVQLAVNKQGVIAGTFYNDAAQVSRPIQGTVDMNTQRAAMTFADGNNTDRVIETSIYNLTQDEAPALLHFGADQSQPVLLVRLQQPAQAAPSP